MKVFGIGLNKTGTKTLAECFRTFGFNNYSYDQRLLEDFFNNKLESIYKVSDTYSSFEDWPWPLIYKEMDEKYADAKFVLTMRKDPETWFSSLCKHSDRTGPTLAKYLVYGYHMPHQMSNSHIEYYLRHAVNVREYFKGRPGKMIEVCWDTGDNWKILSDFLETPIPDLPFPHRNKSK